MTVSVPEGSLSSYGDGALESPVIGVRVFDERWTPVKRIWFRADAVV